MIEKFLTQFRRFTWVLLLPLLLAGWRTPDAPTPTQLAEPTSFLYLPVVANAYDSLCPSPGIFFDYVPPLGSYENLRGHAACVNPAVYEVAVYINTSGWWTKPYFASPLTSIQGDGAWVTDITTGGSDEQATDIAAFLVPQGYTPPQMSGGAVLPEELFNNSAAYTFATRRAVRTISFSGYTWNVKHTPILAGPGPNYFSDDPADVWVDENGSLHLKIAFRDGAWYSTEVICTETLQYGTYSLTARSRVDLLDKNAVLGFFTWDDAASQNNYREIDIEFSRWGEDTALNAQYVVQPWETSGNRQRFDLDLSGDESTHRFDWQPESIQFESRDGDGTPLQSWTYADTANIPPAGGGNARINLWLFNGQVPSDGKEVEVVIKSFQFTPASQ